MHDIVGKLLPEAERFLCDLIRFPSVSGRELDAMSYVHDAFSRLGLDASRVPLSDSLKADPDYQDPIPDLTYDGRFNVRVVRHGRGGGRTLLLNTHLDVVPPNERMDSPWAPRVRDGVVYGRGACDAKGQAATVYLAFKALAAMGAEFDGDTIVHFVVEEENGGNGTLAMARAGEKADACLVLEPSDGRLFTSSRGAVWFRLTFAGRSGHSGTPGSSRSALLMAREAMSILEAYHAKLLAASRGFPLFDPHPNPMPLTFGRLEAGNWPSAAPQKAVLEGVLGLLPNKTRDQVAAEMRQALVEGGDEYFRSHFELHFMYRHDSSVCNPAHEWPQTCLAAARAAGAPLEVAGMTASCDAWFYNNLLGIPTVIGGPGTLAVAHSEQECIPLAEIGRWAETLVHAVLRFHGQRTANDAQRTPT